MRPVDDNWREVFDLVVREGDLRGRRVLDCGCGTGRLSQALAESAASKVWGVDPEPEMLRVAADNVPAGVGLKAGRAEDLPFRDGWFERAVLWLVCHLVDRPAAFRRAAPRARRRRTARRRHVRSRALRRLLARSRTSRPSRTSTARVSQTPTSSAGSSTMRASRRCSSAVVPRGRPSRGTRHSSGSSAVTSRRSTSSATRSSRTGTHLAMNELPPTVEYPIEWLVAVAER